MVTGTGSRKNTSARRRKISVGPIDFEQRREHIRLAYSRSIRERASGGSEAESSSKKAKRTRHGSSC